MLKLVFGSIIVIFIVGCVFWIGFVLGSTMTPLSPSEPAPSPTSSSSAPAAVVINHG